MSLWEKNQNNNYLIRIDLQVTMQQSGACTLIPFNHFMQIFPNFIFDSLLTGEKRKER